MPDFWIKQNDTAPVLDAILKDSDDVVVDVTGASIRFIMSAIDGTIKVNDTGTVIDGAAGHVRYEWVAADTDTTGTYIAEWEVTYPNSTIETFPSSGYFEIRIMDDLA